MVRFACTLVSTFLVFSVCLADVDSSPVRPDAANDDIEAGFSREGLTDIEKVLKQAVVDGRVNAGIAMLAREGELVWLATAGEMTSGIPMREDAILPLASVGKMFTATSAMILYERGVISLDEPVSDYIPEFANLKLEVRDAEGVTTQVSPERPVTILDLLTHTGGLTVDGDDFWTAWDANVGKTTTTHMARAIAGMPLQAQPGAQFEYGQTGASYEVLAAVIEIASGQTLEAFMTANIFEPLGLEDTYFYLPAEKADRLPEIYRNVDGELQMDRAYGEDFSRSTYFNGGGGVRSAPLDILRFARLFLDGGSVDGVQILKPDTVRLMMSDQLGDRAPARWQPRELSWGFGAAVKYSPEDTVAGIPGQYGWVGGGFAKLWIDPKERLIAYIGFALTPPGDNELLTEFENRVYAALK
jgi:CubicO group peptidase (beta-lactamase class C family)